MTRKNTSKSQNSWQVLQISDGPKKLVPEKITSILEKYSQPENCSEVTVTRVNPEMWAPLNAA